MYINFETLVSKFPEFKFLEDNTATRTHNVPAMSRSDLGVAYYKRVFRERDSRFIPCLIHELCHLTAKPLNRKFLYNRFDGTNFIEAVKKTIEFHFSSHHEKEKPFKYLTKKELKCRLEEELSTSLAAQLIFEMYSLNRYYRAHEQDSIEGHMTRFYDPETLKAALKELDYDRIKREAIRIYTYFLSRIK